MSSERQIDNIDNPWWAEHLQRYQEVNKILGSNKKYILDIACGSGFGSDYLSNCGYDVIGGDLSEEVVLECKSKYKKPNLDFKIIDGTKLDYNDSLFDAVVSFETIEHTRDFQLMLNEFKRVTKTDGLVILSTPNFLVNSPKGFIENPFHTQEWTYDELLKILNSTFSKVELLGQQYIRYKAPLTFNYKIAKVMEWIFYLKGFRKIPLSIQNFVLNSLINQPMYPITMNFDLTANVSEIRKCKTFFAICKP